MIRTLPVAAEMLNLVAAGPCEPVMVWEDQGGRRTLTDRQETDPDTGELVWTAYLMCSVGGPPRDSPGQDVDFPGASSDLVRPGRRGHPRGQRPRRQVRQVGRQVGRLLVGPWSP